MFDSLEDFFHYDYSCKRMHDKLDANSKRRARAAIRSRGEIRDRVEALEDEVYFLNLVNRCLVNLLLKRGLCSQDELIDLLASLDENDGSLDGGSTSDDLAQEMGFDESPVDRLKPEPRAPISSKKRGRR